MSTCAYYNHKNRTKKALKEALNIMTAVEVYNLMMEVITEKVYKDK